MFFVAKEEYSENPYQVEWYQVGSNLNGIEENESFGSSVAMGADGKRIAVGAMNHSSDDGEVRVYDNVEGQWTQVGPSIPGATNERFGQSISISSDGMRVAVGAAYGTETIKVYEYSNASWNKIFEASGVSGDQFGKTISISSDGKRVASGALSDTTNTGYARVYDIDSQTLLVQLAGASTNEYFGSSVSLNSDGTRLAVGADQYQNGNGYVKIYTESEGSWSSLGQISGESNGDRFGHAVSISSNGNRVAVGAYVHASNRGHVRIYEYSGGTWNKIGIDLDGEGSGDEFGFSVSLSSNGKRVMAGGPKYESDDRGVVKVYEETDGTWNQVFSNIGGGAGDKMGRVVSMSSDGNVIVAGSSLATSQDGKVVVYTCVVFENRLMDTTTNDQALTPLSTTIPGTNTFQITKLGQDIDGEAAYDQSGYSVSMSSDGTRMAIGAIMPPQGGGITGGTGKVRVYEWDNVSWSQLGADIDGESAEDYFGTSVSISSDGTRVAIGAPFNNPTNTAAGDRVGHVRVYEWDNVSWSQVGGDIDGEAVGDQSGYSVSMSSDGTRVAIGALFNDGTASNAGHVRVYEYDATYGWNKIGNDIDGEGYGDRSGRSVSLSSDGTRVAIGAYINNPTNNGAGVDIGHVRVYSESSGAWSQLGGDIDGEARDDLSGWSVSISGDGTRVAIGAPYNDPSTGNNAGHVRVYDWNNVSWSQVGQDIDGEAAADNSGWSVSLSSDGTHLAIGSPYNDPSTGDDAGHVRVYVYNSVTPAWEQVGSDIDGEALDDLSGYSLSMSSDGTRVAIGTPFNDGNGISTGRVRVYSLTEASNTDQTINIILSGKRSDYRSIKNIKFDCNGETIFDQSGQYLAYEQSLRHHTGCPSPVYEFYMYSFSLQPEMYYPTGQLNMSRIIHKKIDVELEDVSSLSKTNLSIYAQNYNVLHVESGLAGLKF